MWRREKRWLVGQRKQVTNRVQKPTVACETNSKRKDANRSERRTGRSNASNRQCSKQSNDDQKEDNVDGDGNENDENDYDNNDKDNENNEDDDEEEEEEEEKDEQNQNQLEMKNKKKRYDSVKTKQGGVRRCT